MERQRHAGPPFSRHTLERFIQEQQFDIFQTRQQRLVIETLGGIPVGALDFSSWTRSTAGQASES